MSEEAKKRTSAFVYTILLPLIVEAAREKGYAAALHGSMVRDLDVCLIPWTDEASSAEEVVEAVRQAVYSPGEIDNFHIEPPSEKPHGRLAWTLPIWQGWIDLSVMPRRPE